MSPADFPVGALVYCDGRLGVVVSHTEAYVLVRFGWERPPEREWPYGLDADFTLVAPAALRVAQ